MKKLLAIMLLLAVCALCLVACGDDENSSGSTPTLAEELKGIVDASSGATSVDSNVTVAYGTTPEEAVTLAFSASAEDASFNGTKLNKIDIEKGEDNEFSSRLSGIFSAGDPASTQFPLTQLNFAVVTDLAKSSETVDGQTCDVYRGTVTDATAFFGTAVDVTNASVAFNVQNGHVVSVAISYNGASEGVVCTVSVQFAY